MTQAKNTKSTKKTVAKSPPKAAPKAKAVKSVKNRLISPGTQNCDMKMNGKMLHFTNLDKLYWPKENICKRDLLNYYDSISEFLLPYLRDRPQTLNRHPNGINGPNFYQKNVEGKVVDWAETYSYTSDSEGKALQFFVCEDRAGILYMANLGCIEMNPWHSRIESPERPDWCVIDLDPDGNAFTQVMEVAKVVNQVLSGLAIKSYCKTSGATGIHIYIPLAAKYSYSQSRMFAELLVGIVHRELPNYTSLERNPTKRKRKIYLDFLQNRSIQTIAAPYSVRPRPGAPVSTPLHWDELRKNLTPQKYTINNIHSRLQEMGDIFKPVLGRGIDLEKLLKKVSSLL